MTVQLTEKALVYLLTHDVGVLQVIGTRVYPVALPDSVNLAEGSADLPAVTYSVVSQNEMHEIPVEVVRVQLNIFGRTYADVLVAEDAIVNCLHRYTGNPAQDSVMGVSHRNATALRDPDLGLFYKAVDFRVMNRTEELQGD